MIAVAFGRVYGTPWSLAFPVPLRRVREISRLRDYFLERPINPRVLHECCARRKMVRLSLTVRYNKGKLDGPATRLHPDRHRLRNIVA